MDAGMLKGKKIQIAPDVLKGVVKYPGKCLCMITHHVGGPNRALFLVLAQSERDAIHSLRYNQQVFQETTGFEGALILDGIVNIGEMDDDFTSCTLKDDAPILGEAIDGNTMWGVGARFKSRGYCDTLVFAPSEQEATDILAKNIQDINASILKANGIEDGGAHDASIEDAYRCLTRIGSTAPANS